MQYICTVPVPRADTFFFFFFFWVKDDQIEPREERTMYMYISMPEEI